MKTLLLVDGSSYLYRAFYAMPDLRSPNHQPTGAIYGVANMLLQLTESLSFDCSACVFDAAGKTFRHQLYPPYKAHRPPMPSDLVVQIEPVHRLTAAMGWPVIAVKGVEADDVIGTLAKQAEALNYQVIIVTSDKDFAQLVSDQIFLISGLNNERLDRLAIERKFGVPPEKMIDYLTLVGDKTDNIPGVGKCGPKTALRWLNTYGDLENVMAHASDIEGTVGNELRKTLPDLPLFRQLIRIKCDVDLSHELPNALESLTRQSANTEELLSLCQHYALEHLVKKITSLTPAFLSQATPSKANITQKCYESILTQAAFSNFMARLSQAKIVSFDTETTSTNPFLAELIGMSFSWAFDEAYYIPLAHHENASLSELGLGEVLDALRPWFGNTACQKMGQNIKYDKHVLANYGLALSGIVDDTLLASYVVESHLSHNLDDLAKRHLQYKTITYEEVCGKGAKQIPFSAVPISIATQYAAEDADVALKLNDVLSKKLSKSQAFIYRNIELPISNILFEMERHGVLIDRELLELQSEELGQQMLSWEEKIYQIVGHVFNINSPKQLQHILFNQLGIATTGLKKTPTGDYSTNEDTLEKLAVDYPLPQYILEYRLLAKIKSTYTDKLPLLVQKKTGRIHTHYAQAVVFTGRIASSDPNLQNIPIKTSAGRRVREAFIAPENFLIVSADYSQIELRVMAHLSNDQNLCGAFMDAQDVHLATAAEIFGISTDVVTDSQRYCAKSINFGLIYGMGIYGLAKQLNIPQAQAKQFIERYFARYPQVAEYMDCIKRKATEQGYVDTLFGRRIYPPDLHSTNHSQRARAERIAINAPIQGTAADLIKLAMIKVDQWLVDQKMASKLIMQVHDELVLEVPQEELGKIKEALPRLFADVAKLKVPLIAKVGVGRNWEEAH